MATKTKITSSDVSDPFASEIDEYLKEKKSPQESLKDKVEEEIAPMPSVEQDTPNEEIKKLGEELQVDETLGRDDPKEVTSATREYAKALLKTIKSGRLKAEAKMRSLIYELRAKEYPILANKISLAAFSSPVEILTNLLLKEYQQRDVCETYAYILDKNPIFSQKLKEHFAREAPRLVFLQNCITKLGKVPTSNRLTVPPLSNLSPEGVLALQYQMELENIGDYKAAIQALPEEYSSIKAELSLILEEETKDAMEFLELLSA
jgi:hypothetical protein